MTNQRRAYGFALAAVLAWSTVASAFKLTLRHLTPVELLVWSSAVSTLTLGAVLLVQGKLSRLTSLSRRDVLQSVPLGLLNPFIYYLILFKAYDLLPAQEAQPLNYTWAIVLAFLSIPLLKQKIQVHDFAAAFICYFGVVIISTHGDIMGLKFSNPLGVALALGSTVIWALYWIYNTRSTRDPAVGLFLNFAFSLPPVIAVWLLAGPARLPSLYGLLGAVYVGVFEMGLTFLLWLNALKLTDNTATVGNLIFISPFLSLIFIRFLVGETIRQSSIAGLVLIVTGLLVQQWKRRSG